MEKKFSSPAFAEERDPEFRYRSGYQHGAQAVLEYARGKGLKAEVLQELEHAIAVKLNRWRHDPDAPPSPPKL